MGAPRELIRRLRADDHSELAELCKADRRWPKYFGHHDLWLTRALEDIKRPGRAVFGFFSPVPQPARWSFSNRLDACLFLKPSEFESSAELKNPVVREVDGDVRSRDSLESWLTPLVQKAVQHCEVREIAKLEIELPQAEHELVALFLKLNFHIAAIRDRYRPSLPICILERHLGEVYHADPFAVEKMGSWLLRALLSARVFEPTEFHINSTSVPCIRFEGYPQHPAFARKDSTGYARRLTGSMLILDEGDCDDSVIDVICSHVNFRREQLRYVLAQQLTELSRKKLKDIGVVGFDFNDLREISGGQNSSLSVPFVRSDVGGIVTVLEEERVREYSSFSGSWVYYLLSGLGEALDVPEDGPAEILAIFCPNWKRSSSGFIGIAEIQAKDTVPVHEAVRVFADYPRALSPEDLAFYMSRTENELVTVLLCRPVTLLTNPVDINEASWTGDKEEKDYFLRALEEMNSVYVSNGFADALKSHIEPFFDRLPVPPDHSGMSTENTQMTLQKKILFVSSDPRDSSRLRIQDEFRMIKDELRGSPGSEQFAFELALATRPQDLSRELLKRPRATGLHFSGHGSEAGAICLQDDNGTISPVPAAAIADLIGEIATTLEVVVLNACYSREQAESIMKHVPYVVGMSSAISDRAAIGYAIGFYQALFNGESVPVAHRAACAQVHMISPGEKETPTLLVKGAAAAG